MWGRALAYAGIMACLTLSSAIAGSIVNLKSQAPEGIDVSFQLTDGRVGSGLVPGDHEQRRSRAR